MVTTGGSLFGWRGTVQAPIAKVTDAEVVDRCRFDLRWKYALDLDLVAVDAPFAKSTFQAFRVRLTLHAKEGLAFEQSVKAARKAGLLPRRLRVALDSSPVRGRGAVKDTFNLLSDAIVAVIRTVASKREMPADEVAREAELERHVGPSSIKGSEVINWDDEESVSAFLDGLLQDSERAVKLAQENLQRNGVVNGVVLKGGLYGPVAGRRFDVVLSNPPFSAGFRSVVGPMVEGAAGHLVKGGSLQVVVRWNKGGRMVGSLMEDVFGGFNVLTRGGGYRVLMSVL